MGNKAEQVRGGEVRGSVACVGCTDYYADLTTSVSTEQSVPQ